MKFDNRDSSVPIAKNAPLPYYEYTMTPAMAQYYMDFRAKHGTKVEKGMPWRQYLAKIVNTEFGIRGTCTSLVVS